MRKKNMVILLVLLLTVGFASVSTTLVMNGTIGIAHKKSDFNVIFTNVTVSGNNTAKATISENKKTITFETDKLSTVGDSAELVYKVKNNSTQYDANVSVSCTGGNTEYLSINGEFAGKSLPLATPELMGAQEVRMGKISVELIKSYVGEDTSIPLTCTLEVKVEERESIVEKSSCEYSDGTEWTFDYTGSEQEFKIPCDGEYKLETWGAQGGNVSSSKRGGYGAYAKGEINANENQIVYINVGGQGEVCTNCNTASGGYNGGGNGYEKILRSGTTFSGGGGATHIANNSGKLSSLSEDISSIYIVSGGGAGNWEYPIYNDRYFTVNFGEAGGISSNNTTSMNTDYNRTDITYGATQTSGYKFGIGETDDDQAGGAGGGFYGGRTNYLIGTGGSSYIGNPLLINKAMYCYNCTTSNEESTKTVSTTCTSSTPTTNCAKQENGYAKITLVSAKYQKNEYKEAILNGADPVIKENLVPVTIENDGTVKKADTSSEWYKYEDKKWANAVILSDETINYNAGDTISESNIESYFVWIPKYKYKLWDLGNYSEVVENTLPASKAQEIEIVFGTSNTENINGESCVTPMTSGATGECNVGEYMTHPAFISMGTNGIWVGKFEAGYAGATSTSEAEVNAIDVSKLIVKPNVYSWRNIIVNNMFKTAYNYNRKLDSHMMKNTEWGAVAYLSHSKYGINKEININNNSAHLTGYSAVVGTNQSDYPGESGTDNSKTLSYNTETGYLASTTGNISGVYDMSGGAHEYVSSYISGNPKDSGFTTTTIASYNSKYFDTYNSSSAVHAYKYRILGDATGEMGPFATYADGDGYSSYHNSWYHNSWYDDTSYFVESPHPWFYRGGNCDNGVIGSQFTFDRYNGNPHGIFGFRLVLA